jgi:hypothetical protein
MRFLPNRPFRRSRIKQKAGQYPAFPPGLVQAPECLPPVHPWSANNRMTISIALNRDSDMTQIKASFL